MLEKSMPEITIARHAVQAMLRHALDNQPAICCGLLAACKGRIQVAVPVSNSAANPQQECRINGADAARILAEWQKQPSRWMGVYRSNINPEDTRPDSFENMLMELDSTDFDPDGLLCLAVNLDTDGRLDTHAYQLYEDAWREVPLVLEEDAVMRETRPDA